MTALARRVVAALVAIGMTAIGSPALAAAPARGSDGEAAEDAVGVGVLPLVLAGKVAPEVGDARKRLSQRVVTGLADPALSVVALDVAASGSADAPFCSDRACWQALSQAHGVSHLIVVVVRHSDGDYQIEGRLVDGRTGGEVGAVDNACDLCGLEELGEHVTDVARALRRELKSGIVSAPTLVVKSKPAGATVSIDGEVVGVTPLEVRTPAGQRRIDVSHDGYTNERIDVELVGGTRRVIEASLRPVAADTTESTDRGPATGVWIGAGVGSMVVGGALVGGGAAMIAIHDDPITGDCEGDNVDALGRCKYLHDTRAGGIAMLSVGVAAIATGVALTVIGLKRRQRARANVAFTGRGVALGVRF